MNVTTRIHKVAFRTYFRRLKFFSQNEIDPLSMSLLGGTASMDEMASHNSSCLQEMREVW